MLGLLTPAVLCEPSPSLAGRSLHWVIRVSTLEDTLAFMLDVLGMPCICMLRMPSVLRMPCIHMRGMLGMLACAKYAVCLACVCIPHMCMYALHACLICVNCMYALRAVCSTYMPYMCDLYVCGTFTPYMHALCVALNAVDEDSFAWSDQCPNP